MQSFGLTHIRESLENLLLYTWPTYVGWQNIVIYGDTLLRDQLVWGIKDDKIQEKLLQASDLSSER